ncbi:MAG: exodeoxyribonuclease VII small subunit [Oscillospiraceae bacterium]|jgi:exodeoxyribonuclease VII small subunit|nr:exodeoxyribonuclease VII small subunit [Oscillospiraceae bacterium]
MASFEQSLRRLDEIVKRMEKGDVPLEEALSLFEEGTALVGACNAQLDNAELKVTQLSRGADGSPEEKDFTDEI